MLQLILDYRLDCVAFALLALVAMLSTQALLRRRCGASLSLRVWLLVLFVVCSGTAITEIAGDHERHRLRQMLEGIAPTSAARSNASTTPSSASTRPRTTRPIST